MVRRRGRGASRYVVFRDTRGETEFVGVEWEGENVFRVHEHPLRVDGVTLLHYVGDYRHEDGVSVFCIHPDELEAFAGEEGVTLQEMLPGVWAFTDGG